MPLLPVSSGDPHVAAHNAERDAINALETAMDTKITLPAGAATGDFLRWDGVQWTTTETRFFEGEGRPDGAFAAPVGSRYIDKTASQGAVEWVKRSGGDSNAGWMCLAGDTGLRNIASLVSKPAGAIINTAYVRRIGQVVDFYFDLTMPSSTANWQLLTSLAGFAPGFNRYAGLQDNSELGNTRGTVIEADGGIVIYGPQPGNRDRYEGTFLTPDPWPTSLPGVAA